MLRLSAALLLVLIVVGGLGVRSRLQRRDRRLTAQEDRASGEAEQAVKEPRRLPWPSTLKANQVARQAIVEKDSLVQQPHSFLSPSEELDRSKKVFETLEARMHEEQADPIWGKKETQEIEDEFRTLAFQGARLRDVKCAATLCRVIVANDNLEAQRNLPFALTKGPFSQGVTFSYSKVNNETTAWVERARTQ